MRDVVPVIKRECLGVGLWVQFLADPFLDISLWAVNSFDAYLLNCQMQVIMVPHIPWIKLGIKCKVYVKCLE